MTVLERGETRSEPVATMYEHYTDAENTGAPLVPMVEEQSPLATDGGQTAAEELDEVVFSHRLRE
ncbi:MULTISPECIES: hypothetical protein [Salinibaculum]|uniref:hypothetical protein n=1 Tax=Salinibaculum TaxID=2732368 RepID=UPI0030D5F9CD